VTASGIDTSYDGINWDTNKSMGSYMYSASNVNGLILVNGSFTAGFQLIVSSDAETWLAPANQPPCPGPCNRLKKFAKMGNALYGLAISDMGDSFVVYESELTGSSWDAISPTISIGGMSNVGGIAGNDNILVLTTTEYTTDNIRTSLDGITWDTQTQPHTVSLQGVIWDGSQFVACGSNGTIITSPDGIVWTSQNNGTGEALYDLYYNGTTYVTVGSNGAILTSPDSITWSAQTSGTTEYLRYVTGKGNEILAVSQYGLFLISYDQGVTWGETRNTLAPNMNSTFYAIGSNGTRYVIGTQTNNQVFISDDGINWTEKTGSGTYAKYGAFGESGGSTWVLIGYASYAYSFDNGDTWASGSMPSWISYYSVTYDPVNSVYVGVGQSKNIVTSADLTGAWTTQTSPAWLANTTIRKVIYDGTQLVFVTENSSVGVSTDGGVTWIDKSMGPSGIPSNTWYDFIYDGSKYIFVGRYRIVTSTDLITYTEDFYQTSPYIAFTGIAKCGSQYTIVGYENSEAIIFSSTDGTNWSYGNAGTKESPQDIACNGSQFIAVGYNGSIIVSP
jgi:hypothetical protein